MHPYLLLTENSLFKAVGQVFHPLFVAVAYVLAAIYSVVPDYAAAIVLLTVLIMALLTPLTIKSTRSMVAMQALQPEMQKLRQKYKGTENRQQLNEEMMRLYRENNVSPTGGCLPMFLQMPALIVLYDVIRGLANTIAAGTKFPTKTLLPKTIATKVTGRTVAQLTSRMAHTASHLINVTGLVCQQKVHGCAVPRYIPTSSAMYGNLVKSPGVMKSIGLNLAAKPLTHHSHWYDYIPYIAMVLAAVGLQYFQMAQMTRRNRNSQQQMPQQMQTMQRIMPLIFAYIYFLVPAGVVIYMIVSSAIRVLTQDLIFRYGLVQRPGERRIGSGAKAGGPIPASSSVRSSRLVRGAAGGNRAPPEGDGEGNGSRPALPSGQGPQEAGGGTAAAPRNPATGGGGRRAPNGRARQAPQPAAPKVHPRSKAKRARKAR